MEISNKQDRQLPAVGDTLAFLRIARDVNYNR